MEKRDYRRDMLPEALTCELNTWVGKVETFIAKVIDISTGGARILTNGTHTPGKVVKLALPRQGTETALPGFAEVRWAQPVGNSGKFLVGLQFLAGERAGPSSIA
ncbi:MAG: PilZ domain-containing protein [Thermodesulfobacteriota bacterium]